MRPLIEAAEAFPAFESEAARAETEIFFGMRLFEADLPLATAAAKAEGARTWAELLAQKAAAGVQVRILLSDFQPEIATKLHEDAWRSVEGFLKAADAAGASENLSIMASLHPGEIGRIARLALWPVVRLRLGDLRKRIDAGYDMDLTPGLWSSLRRGGAEVRGQADAEIPPAPGDPSPENGGIRWSPRHRRRHRSCPPDVRHARPRPTVGADMA